MRVKEVREWERNPSFNIWRYRFWISSTCKNLACCPETFQTKTYKLIYLFVVAPRRRSLFWRIDSVSELLSAASLNIGVVQLSIFWAPAKVDVPRVKSFSLESEGRPLLADQLDTQRYGRWREETEASLDGGKAESRCMTVCYCLTLLSNSHKKL